MAYQEDSARFVYNYGLNMINVTQAMTKINKFSKEFSLSYNQPILGVKTVFTNYVKKQAEYS